MSLAQKVVETLKSLVAHQPKRDSEEVGTEHRQLPVVQPSRSPENTIGEALGVSPSAVARACYGSNIATEWCIWIADILTGRRRDPPGRTAPDDIFSMLIQLVERGFRDPLFERIVESRKRFMETLNRAMEAVDGISRPLVEGKLKVAKEGLKNALERLVTEVKLLNENVDEAVSSFAGKLEEELRRKYKAPIREGELVKNVVEGLRTVGLEKTAEKTVEFVASSFKSMEKPTTVKAAFKEGTAELELHKEPVKRI